MQTPPVDQRRPSIAWPIAVTLIAIVAILALAGYLVFRQVARVPAAAVEQTKEAMAAARDLALAFRQGTVETRFLSYVTSVSGSTYLQVAAVDRMEVFTREDRASIFWGTVPLPEVVVSAAAPVHYTAFVDLDEPWTLRLDEATLTVVAPPIRFNPPAIDASEIEYEIESDSLLRDEEAALVALKKELTSQSYRRSRELIPLVRETAREKIQDFVGTWLVRTFPETRDLRIEVTFSDEEKSAPFSEQSLKLDSAKAD